MISTNYFGICKVNSYRNQKMLFPPHKDIVWPLEGFTVKGIRVESFWEMAESTIWKINILLHTDSYDNYTIINTHLNFAQCLRSTSSSASHFRVRKGLFLLMISPSKNVVRVGYSSVSPFILRYPHKYPLSSSTC